MFLFEIVKGFVTTNLENYVSTCFYEIWLSLVFRVFVKSPICSKEQTLFSYYFL